VRSLGGVRIGELAERAGVSPRALRYYEQQGLLSPSRDANGYRVYDDHALVLARNIKRMLAVGLTTEDVREHLERGCLDKPLEETPRCAPELHTVQRRLAGLDERIERLLRQRELLARHSAEVERELAAPEGSAA
jgi:MerR family copper efflux transcriptional regulator